MSSIFSPTVNSLFGLPEGRVCRRRTQPRGHIDLYYIHRRLDSNLQANRKQALAVNFPDNDLLYSHMGSITHNIDFVLGS